MNNYTHSKKDILRQGFSIIKLIVVIVVIGILIMAIVTIVEKNKAVYKSDLEKASSQLELYKSEYKSYPTALDINNCPTTPVVNTNYCLKVSKGYGLSYTGDSESYSLSITNASSLLNLLLTLTHHRH